MADNDPPESFDDPFKGSPGDTTTQDRPVPTPPPTPPPEEASGAGVPPSYGKPDKPPETGAYTAPPDVGKPITPAKAPVTTGSVTPDPAHVEKAAPAPSHFTYDDMLKAKQQMMAQQKQEWDAYQRQMLPLNKAVLQSLKEPPPPVPQLPESPPPPSQKESTDALKKSAIGYLAVALPLAVLMGARGGWAFAGAWGGFGKGLTALTEGNQQAADDSFKRWMEIDRVAHQKFSDQMEVYKAQLSNRNMTTQQMMDMISFSAKQFGDNQTREAAEMSNWQGMLDILAKKDEARRKYDQYMESTAIKKKVMEKLGHSKDYDDWADIMNQKAIQELGHPFRVGPDHPVSEEERALLRKYPLDEYWKTRPKPAAPGAPEQKQFEGDEGQSDHELFKDYFSDEPPASE